MRKQMDWAGWGSNLASSLTARERNNTKTMNWASLELRLTNTLIADGHW